MGVVYVGLREEGRFRRLYAVKRLHPHLSDDASFRAMFLDEARIAGLVQHPNVVGVLDVGEDAEGPFMVMEYIDGVNLAQLIDGAVALGVVIPVQIAVRVAREVARGLGAVHELTSHDGEKLHLVHRDLSPQNVLLGFDGSVRITDFGIAKALGRLTETGAPTLKGKLAYASPEQILCQPIDHRSDLFSLAVVIHEMLTGRQLYRNIADNEGSRRLLHDAPPDVGEERPDVPPELAQLLFRMLAKDPAQRPESAGEIYQELEVLLSDLVGAEGPLDLQAFVADIAKDAREERRRMVDVAVAHATEVDAGTPGARMTKSRRTRWRALAVVGVTVGVLGTATAVALTSMSEPEDAATAVQRESAPRERAQVEVPSEATVLDTSPESGFASPAGGASQIDEPAVPVVRTRPRARRREAGAPPAAPDRQTLGRWSFDDR
jgi:tRNA A-37 threonylcarbamoyl transferase component Bud32